MILKACAIALIGALTAFILRELGVRSVGIFGVVCGAVILSMGLDAARDMGIAFSELAELCDIAEIAADILKIIGVGYIFGICSDICSEVGEAGTGSALALIGRLEVVGIALPYFKKIIDTAISLLK